MQAPVTLKGLYVMAEQSRGGDGGNGAVLRIFSKSVKLEGSFFKFRSRPNIELFMTRTKLEFGST